MRRSWLDRKLHHTLAWLLVAVALARVGSSGEAPADLLNIRVETEIGDSSDWLTTTSTNYDRIGRTRSYERIAGRFVAPEGRRAVAITFSAEARVDPESKRMFVRALVDGEIASPADVVLVSGWMQGTRSFIFTANVDPGIHTVEIQWMVDPGSTGSLRDVSLRVRAGVVAVTPPSGPNLEIDSVAYQDVPGMSGEVVTAKGDTLMIAFSAEAIAKSSGRPMRIQVLLDDLPLAPGGVRFASLDPPTTASTRHSRMFVWGHPKPAPARHKFRVQWSGTGIMGDRSVVAEAFPGVDLDAQAAANFASANAYTATKSTKFTTVPGLGLLLPVGTNGEVAVTFTAEAMVTGGSLYARAKVGSTESQEVEIASDGTPLEAKSFVFDVKNYFNASPGGDQGLAGVTIEWRVSSPSAVGALVVRSLAAVVERGATPDLAEPMPFGLGVTVGIEPAGIEPAAGTFKVMTIIFDPHRPAPDDMTLTSLAVQSALFGPHGVSDFFAKQSDGRVTLQDEGIYEVDAKKDSSHYWTVDTHTCECMSGCDADESDPALDGYSGGHAERWAEAVDSVSTLVDFSQYDRNGDGFVHPWELAILIVTPQAVPAGDIRNFVPYCSEAIYSTNGVEVLLVGEWFTSDPSKFGPGAHELAHLLLNLGDMYPKAGSHLTRPGRFSLMDGGGAQSLTTGHIDGPTKLALGWATPRTVSSDGWIEVVDIKLGGEVLVLPRDSSFGGEYFALENRQDSASSPFYDEGIVHSGIAVWHAIHSFAANGATPVCDDGQFAAATGDDNVRRGIRLVTPLDIGDLWNDTKYDLTDGPPVCGGTTPSLWRNALEWVDSTPSGYGVSNFPAPASTMTVFIDVP